MMFMQSLADRFMLEPRCSYTGSHKWLVAFDLVKQDYVKVKGSKREFAKWSNSQKAFEDLQQSVAKGEL